MPKSTKIRDQVLLQKSLDRLEQIGCPSDSSTFERLLQLCGNEKALSNGKRVHNYIIQNGLQPSKFLENLTMQMYVHCGALDDARELFNRMHQRDEFSWNFIVRAYAQLGQSKEALRLFEQMQQEGVMLDKFLVASALSACVTPVTLTKGQQLHACMLSSGLEVDVVLGTALVNMYGKCGSLAEARRTFEDMSERDIVSWNAMISGYAQQQQLKDALELCDRMLCQGIIPNNVTFVSVLSAFSTQANPSAGKKMHTFITRSSLESDINVGNALINMYGKCGIIRDAWETFGQMLERNTSSWTSMITVLVHNGQSSAAFELFAQMEREGFLADRVTYITMLSACAGHAALAEGQGIHSLMLQSEFELDLEVGNALVNMYGKCGSVEAAQRIFDRMPKHSLVSWNSMIDAYDRHDQGQVAIQLLNKMLTSGIIPDEITYISLFSVCVAEFALDLGRVLHSYALCSGFDADGRVGNALLNMYGKFGYLEDVWKVFDKMLDRDVVSWNAIVALDCQQTQGSNAVRLFVQMMHEAVMPCNVTVISLLSAFHSQASLDEGKRVHACVAGSCGDSDILLWNAVINMYGKCGSIDYAWSVFESMSERDAVSWTALIDGYVYGGQCHNAVSLFYQMQQEAAMPDRVTFLSIFSVFASQAAVAKGKQIHACTLGSVLELDVSMGNALINLYGKCGSLKEARKSFDKMSSRDVVSWTSLIAIYAQHGKVKEALALFSQMQQSGVVPDRVTLLIVLCACSHTGLIDEGCYWFDHMKKDFGITPMLDHLNCIVDLLGRAGRLDKAENMIYDMPFESTVVTWMTLLGACRYQVDVERGERAANHVFKLDPDDPTPYIMLSNIYAAAGMGENATRLMNQMREKGIKERAYSGSVEVRGRGQEIFDSY